MANNEDTDNIKIAVSGKSGCGNTTVSRLLADALGLSCINFTFRNLAEEKGLSLKEVIELAAKDDAWDREVDARQVELAREEGGCVLGSRLAIWMLPEAIVKVFLDARPETRARRIHGREGESLEAIMEFTSYRDAQDHERYLRIYNIDNDDYGFADIVIPTDNMGPDEIVARILEKLYRKLSH